MLNKPKFLSKIFKSKEEKIILKMKKKKNKIDSLKEDIVKMAKEFKIEGGKLQKNVAPKPVVEPTEIPEQISEEAQNKMVEQIQLEREQLEKQMVEQVAPVQQPVQQQPMPQPQYQQPVQQPMPQPVQQPQYQQPVQQPTPQPVQQPQFQQQPMAQLPPQEVEHIIPVIIQVPGKQPFKVNLEERDFMDFLNENMRQ